MPELIAPQFEGDLIIGEYYRVPTVKAVLINRARCWPVLGPRHEDKAIIGFRDEHYHLDFRFFSDELMDWLQHYIDPIHRYPLVDRDELKMGPVIFRRRQCYRLMPEFPQGVAPWRSKLREAYKNHKLTAALICPHKGALLKGLPVDSDNCVTCPLHGLRWNLTTGRPAWITEE